MLDLSGSKGLVNTIGGMGCIKLFAESKANLFSLSLQLLVDIAEGAYAEPSVSREEEVCSGLCWACLG